jgi:ABC-type branched-subunit amino acid transport system permease subunit
MVGPYCPVCLTHSDDATLINLPAVPDAAVAPASERSWREWLPFVALPLLMVVGAAVAVVWDVPNLWLLLVPVACITLVCGLRVEA